MSLSSDNIKEVCYRVMTLGRLADWTFKGMPVMQWEFATIPDYARARKDLLVAMSDDLKYMIVDPSKGPFRRVSEHIEELDCYGVTFRLICKQQIMTRHGPYGAADAGR